METPNVGGQSKNFIQRLLMDAVFGEGRSLENFMEGVANVRLWDDLDLFKSEWTACTVLVWRAPL